MNIPQLPAIPNPFRLAAEQIADRILPAFRRSGSLYQDLTALSAGRKDYIRDFTVRKITDTLTVTFFLLLALAAVFVMSARQSRALPEGKVSRPGYGQGTAEEELSVQIEGEEESESFVLQVQAQRYTDAQVQELLSTAAAEVPEILRGSNASLDEIRTDFDFRTSLCNGAVKASYSVSPYGVADPDGIITAELTDEGTLVEITVQLTCQEEEQTVRCGAMLYPPLLSDAEQLREDLRRAVRDADSDDLTDASVTLPSEVNGRSLSWSYPKNSLLPVLVFLALLLPAAVWSRADSAVHEQAKRRAEELALDYSELMWKLTMLLSAGMTIRGAFTRITQQYLQEQKKVTGPRYVYEEMLFTLREMQSGVPEGTAYEGFGRRCALPAYIKLGSLLAQNLRKGARGLTALLEKEAITSMEEHKCAARKLGERAGVRLLMPMILMFGVVLAILMIPAFLAL